MKVTSLHTPTPEQVFTIQEGGQITYDALRVGVSDLNLAGSAAPTAVFWYSYADSPKTLGVTLAPEESCQIAKYCVRVQRILQHQVEVSVSKSPEHCPQSLLIFQPTVAAATVTSAANILKEISLKYGETAITGNESLSLGFLRVASEEIYLSLHIKRKDRSVWVYLSEGDQIRFPEHCLQVQTIRETSDGYPMADFYILHDCTNPQIIWQGP